jgi:hypothetical protein
MAYKPNPNREIVDGKAKVSAKELAEFQDKYGKDKTLRDLLNADKGLSRKKESEDIQKSTDALPSMSRTQGETKTTQGATYPKPRARSLVDQGRGVQLYKDVDKDAVLQAGLGMASLYPGTIAARTAYGVARPAIGAAAKYLSKKDSPASSKTKEDPPLFKSEKKSESGLFDDVSPREFKKGGKVSSVSKRGDGIAQRGRTKGRFI